LSEAKAPVRVKVSVLFAVPAYGRALTGAVGGVRKTIEFQAVKPSCPLRKALIMLFKLGAENACIFFGLPS